MKSGHEGLEAQSLEGGYGAWREFRQPLVRASKIPRHDEEGRTVWVTRARPKIVRVACPWLIRRFIDPSAVFLFVPPAEVAGVAEHTNATPFDVDGSFWFDRGVKTTFDVMVEDFGLDVELLSRLARIGCNTLETPARRADLTTGSIRRPPSTYHYCNPEIRPQWLISRRVAPSC